jgi:hypothetical protein
MTTARPSNFPTVYMLDVPTCSFPRSAYHNWMFPLPLSGPVVRKSKSTAHEEYANVFSDHIAPLWLPGAGGVSITLFDRTWGGSGVPLISKLGMVRRFEDILWQADQRLNENGRAEGLTCYCDQNLSRC